jgi:high affinity Mn2+ porin
MKAIGAFFIGFTYTALCLANDAPVTPIEQGREAQALNSLASPSLALPPLLLDEDWSHHFQLTTITQTHFGFHSPYQGVNSLSSRYEIPSSVTSTIFLGHKLWRGAYLFVNPEESIGSGLSATHGIAGFPNGEIYRVDDPSPKTNLSRLFYQQEFGWGDESEKIEDDKNQFAAKKDVERATFIAGKFSLNDYFDDNAYSHDPRTQFMNWALMDNGAWDYAADTRGYTWGFYGELHLKYWSFRVAVVQVPAIANQLDLDGDIVHANAENIEMERRYALAGHPGVVRLLGYVNHAHMGNYRQAIQQGLASGTTPDVTTTRAYSSKYGWGLNLEQEVTADLGVFSRIGWDDGATETWAFTEIDRDLSFGASLKGTSWRRADDTIGLAFMVNGLSKDHADYLSAGGNGFLVGDGPIAGSPSGGGPYLNYAPEQIVEAYYSYKVFKPLSLTADFQFVNHPGYNSDRGPVPIYAFRMHFEI